MEGGVTLVIEGTEEAEEGIELLILASHRAQRLVLPAKCKRRTQRQGNTRSGAHLFVDLRDLRAAFYTNGMVNDVYKHERNETDRGWEVPRSACQSDLPFYLLLPSGFMIFRKLKLDDDAEHIWHLCQNLFYTNTAVNPFKEAGPTTM